MAYQKKGGWGGKRERKNGGKHSDYVKIYNDLHATSSWPSEWKPQSYKEAPRCPDCQNEDGELITQLREGFYKCEKCKRHFDIDEA